MVKEGSSVIMRVDRKRYELTCPPMVDTPDLKKLTKGEKPCLCIMVYHQKEVERRDETATSASLLSEPRVFLSIFEEERDYQETEEGKKSPFEMTY